MKKLLLSLLVNLILLSTSSSLNAQKAKKLSWPREVKVSDFTILVYQPQNVKYVDLRLTSNSAVSVKRGKDGKPVFGMMWTTAILDVDRESRMASLASITVDEVRFPDEVSESQKEAFSDVIESEVPKWEFLIPMQELIDSMKMVSSYQAELNNDPPKIIFADEPSVLIISDGEPKFQEAEEGYEVIVNSSAFIAKVVANGTYYLKGGDFWYSARSASGPWTSIKQAPAAIEKLSEKAGMEADENEAEAEKTELEAPRIIMATEPSELIVTDGEINFSPLDNTNLLYVENTQSNLFMHIEDQHYYLLISGRWFHAESVNGNWQYQASEDLPETFKQIDPEGPKGEVLANVAGTDQARDAIYDAQLPQTAAVDKSTKASEVTYNGEPEFEKIKGLDLEYAKNTNSSVFKDGDRYFLCDNAIWFQSDSPKGPWVVSEERPEEVDDIPADNPQYNTKYVYIYETSPTVVYVGYVPGYYGSYVYGGTVVYGTGFYYNPWYMGHYYYRPYSYGFSMRYSTGSGWSVGFSFGSPYGWYGHSYWGVHYHWGPSYYRPPYYRYGYRRPVPARPIYHANRSGVNRYQRPSTLPSSGANRPATRPSTRPSNRPNQPITRPASRPSQPSTRPATKPSQPSTRPSYQRPSGGNYNRPSGGNYNRPTTRPSAPASRPSARPASRPAAMPSRGGGGMRRR
jgi:hypothetical protein